jgi:nickel transport protein
MSSLERTHPGHGDRHGNCNPQRHSSHYYNCDRNPSPISHNSINNPPIHRNPIHHHSSPINLAPLALLSPILAIAQGTVAWSHGANLDYHLAPSVEIQAHYDSGEPMVKAQVAVFAPADSANPWQTGITDDQGGFRFQPDPTQPGNWEVQVRQAGHGDVVVIPLKAEGTDLSQEPEGATLSLGQRLTMIGLGLWGCLGTGLFFSRRFSAASQAPAPSDPDLPKDGDTTAELALKSHSP